MWSRESRAAFRRFARFAAAALIAATAAACFQPMYGHVSRGGTPLAEMLAAIDIQQIDAPKGTALSRLAVEVRNELLFEITGGAGSAPPTHRLNIRLSSSVTSVILDVTTGRPEYENFGLDATYSLLDIKNGRQVLSGTAVTRVTYDIPGQQQRFARARGLHDAESRAAKVIADQIKTRLASYFVAGT
jgi:LPS-assembly lipoprotein